MGPLGHLPASGTATVVVVGVPIYAWLTCLPANIYALVTIAVIGVSVWIHSAGDRLLKTKDSRQLVWDELAGFMVAVAFLPFSWKLAAIAVVLERGLDIAKVQPAAWIETHWPRGWGVVGDDLVAGLYTLGLLNLALHYWPELGV